MTKVLIQTDITFKFVEYSKVSSIKAGNLGVYKVGYLCTYKVEHS